MKLKKIASLALAGIMAVSMLTACGEGAGNGGNGGEGEGEGQGTVTGYSATILNDTQLAKFYATAQDSAQLTSAVNAIVKTDIRTLDWSNNSLFSITNADQSWVVTVADNYMTGASFDSDFVNWNTNNNDNKLLDAKDKTVYALYFISKDMTDDLIDRLVANKLDQIAKNLVNQNVDTDEYDFTVNLAKADWLEGTDADKTKDGVIIGIAITVDYTAPSYN